MARTLLVVPTASGASLARTCLGVVRALDRVTEPILRPIRRLLPPVRRCASL